MSDDGTGPGREAPDSGGPGNLLDVSRLDPEERKLWDHVMSGPSRDGPAVEIWSFGYICMLELGRVPDVVTERLRELDPENLIRQYQENVRRARWEGRL